MDDARPFAKACSGNARALRCDDRCCVIRSLRTMTGHGSGSATCRLNPGLTHLGVDRHGRFRGLFDFGFTRRLYDAARRFELREGLRADGVLEHDEMARLKAVADAFYARLGNSYYAHPETGAKLLVPRKLFDREEETDDGMIFSRETACCR